MRPRFALLLLPLLLCASAGFPTSRAQEHRPEAAAADHNTDRVYHYRGADGRDMYTNAGQAAIDGKAVAPMVLPELRDVDLDSASREQLLALDQSLQRTQDELQSGPRCQAIRASLRIPLSSFLWREHLRELMVAIALLAAALIVFSSWGGRLRSLMPLAPLLACVYLGYSTLTRIEHRMAALREGLHACSSDLPAAESVSAGPVKGRLERALDLQATIDRAYAARAATIERIMSER